MSNWPAIATREVVGRDPTIREAQQYIEDIIAGRTFYNTVRAERMMSRLQGSGREGLRLSKRLRRLGFQSLERLLDPLVDESCNRDAHDANLRRILNYVDEMRRYVEDSVVGVRASEWAKRLKQAETRLREKPLGKMKTSLRSAALDPDQERVDQIPARELIRSAERYISDVRNNRVRYRTTFANRMRERLGEHGALGESLADEIFRLGFYTLEKLVDPLVSHAFITEDRDNRASALRRIPTCLAELSRFVDDPVVGSRARSRASKLKQAEAYLKGVVFRADFRPRRLNQNVFHET